MEVDDYDATTTTTISANVCEVVVPVPTVCINCDDRGEDRPIKNHLVIRYDHLLELVRLAATIETTDLNNQVSITHKFLECVTELKDDQHKNDTAQILRFLASAAESTMCVAVDEPYVDATTEGISFDPIRRYENDPTTGVLVRHANVGWGGRSFYSQFGDDDATKANVRKEMNETELNQIYYTLERFEQTLLFHGTRAYSQTIRLFSLCMFYLALVENSRPLQDMCEVDMSHCIIGYMMDMFVRSRVVTKWRQSPCARNVIMDITRNYDRTSLLVVLSTMETARERAEYYLRNFAKQSEDSRKIVTLMSYAEYEKLLQETVHTINGVRYYVLRRDFVQTVLSTQAFNSLMTYSKQEDFLRFLGSIPDVSTIATKGDTSCKLR